MLGIIAGAGTNPSAVSLCGEGCSEPTLSIVCSTVLWSYSVEESKYAGLEDRSALV